MTLQQLLDRHAIHRVHMSYSPAVDRRDASLLRAVLTSDACISDDPTTFEFRGIDEIASRFSRLHRYRNTAHYMMNTTFLRIHGDEADTEIYALAYHQYPDEAPPEADGHPPQYLAAIRYQDHLVRRQGQWKIQRRLLAVQWTQGQGIRVKRPA
ncbi:MAG: nuclear transport factor 2 family protein [Dehalococcoidia bacterium]|nr:nuclear transport factor 2 family protein [Dehalococcoidia bacterium]